MVISKGTALGIVSDCQGALDDFFLGIEGNEDPTLLLAFEHIQALFRRVVAIKTNQIDALRDVHVLYNRLVALPSFRSIAKIEISGITLASRIGDFARGVDVLIDYSARQGSGPKIGFLGDTLLKERRKYAEGIFKELMDADTTLKSIFRKDVKDSRPHDMGYQMERIVGIARQLILAGQGMREPVIASLLTSLDKFIHFFDHELTDSKEISVRSTIESVRVSLRNLAGSEFVDGNEQDVGILPEQALAPFQFAITGEKLTLRRQEANSKAGADAIAAAALNALRGIAEDLYEDLEKSNHPRLFRAFTRLQNALNAEASVVEIGMLCASFEGQVGAASDELSDSLVALLSGFVKGVTDYAAQFEEWQDFSDNAAEANYTARDGETYAQVARALANELERRPEVDDRVPDALRQVADWNERSSTPKSRLSIGRTVLNLIAVCYTEMVAKPLKAAAGTMGTVVGVGMGGAAGAAVVAIVLNQASVHIAELAKPPEAAWLRPASKVIDAHLRKLENP